MCAGLHGTHLHTARTYTHTHTHTHTHQISLFHRAFFNSIMDKTPTHALFTQHYSGTTRVTTHTCYSIAATTPELTIEILNSVF